MAPTPTPPLKGRGLKDRKFPPHGLATRRRDTELKARIHKKGDCHDDRPSSPALCPGRTCAAYLGRPAGDASRQASHGICRQARKSVVAGKCVAVRVDPVDRPIIKKKKKQRRSTTT